MPRTPLIRLALVVPILAIVVGGIILGHSAGRKVLAPTATSKPTSTPWPTSTPLPTATPRPTATPKHKSVFRPPTPTPYPTWTPTPPPPTWTPTATPVPVHPGGLPTAVPSGVPTPTPAPPVYSSSSPLATACCTRFPRWMRHKWDYPNRLLIPTLGINASVESIALSNVHQQEAPYSWWDVAWFSRGPLPGAPGVAFMFGHLDSTTGIAVFWYLHNLVPGDRITVTYHRHRPVIFEVIDSQVYWDAQVPMSFLLSPNRYHLLAIMTCAGIFHPGPGYDHRLIVLAKEVT